MRRTVALIKIVVLTLLFALLCASGSIVVAQAETTYQVGDHIQFGTYPQTRVNGTTALKEAANAATWKSYGYYTCDDNITPSDYMLFADFFVGGEKYRAVTFSAYRPIDTNYMTGTTYQDDNGYSPNKLYYFKYEPLTWRVLDPSSGYIMCEKIIDSQAYQNTVYRNGNQYYNAIDSSIFASDYAASTIRDWLNNDFYKTAFTDQQMNKITTSSFGSKDRIYLISYSDAKNPSYGFSSSYREEDVARKTKGTDYAKCQGLDALQPSLYQGNSWWWLGSPGGSSAVAHVVGKMGSLEVQVSVNNTYVGVRPACKLSNLQSDISQSDFLFSGGTHEHQSGELVIENEVPATCKAKGSYDEVVYCMECGDELSRTPHETAMLGHDYINHDEKNPTCTTIGWYAYQTCSRCEYTSYFERESLGHDYGEWYISINPTCTAAGEERSNCSRCDNFETRTVNPNGHDFDAVVTAPTCTEQGYTTYTCKHGDDSYTADYVPATGHTEVIDAAVAATCTETGLTEGKHCSACTEVLVEQQVVPAHGHDFALSEIIDANCSEDGEKIYVCKYDASHTRTETIPATGNHEDADNDGHCDTCEQQMTGGKHCKYCGQIHGGAFGWLIKIFHNILALFKR